MGKSVEFFYDFVSTPCFIAWKVLPALLETAGASLVLTPVLTAGIQKATGNPGPLAYPDKRDWYVRDLALWIRKRGLTVSPELHVPFRSLDVLRGSFIAAERNETTRYVGAVFGAVFEQGRNLDDMAVVRQCLDGAGLDAKAYLEGIERADVKDRLRRSTDDALARRVFGVPTFMVDGELFFGQDRIEFVMDALGRA